jgi:hypothetical protein
MSFWVTTQNLSSVKDDDILKFASLVGLAFSSHPPNPENWMDQSMRLIFRMLHFLHPTYTKLAHKSSTLQAERQCQCQFCLCCCHKCSVLQPHDPLLVSYLSRSCRPQSLHQCSFLSLEDPFFTPFNWLPSPKPLISEAVELLPYHTSRARPHPQSSQHVNTSAAQSQSPSQHWSQCFSKASTY